MLEPAPSYSSPAADRHVAVWLLVGIGMLIMQVLLGGITRLTGSGLSITEWKPIMGALPPLNDRDWQEAFDKYKEIAQYKYLNSYFTLHDFKLIFFWEWLHRLWARLIFVAFIIPFIIFLIQRKLKRKMIKPLIILLLLGGLQGLIGWIMVKSGLEDSELIYVSHYKLAIHFILALGLVCYALWFALDLLIPKSQWFGNSALKKFTIWLTVITGLQLVYGAFMAGLKAAPAAATWPDITGQWLPSTVKSFGTRHYPGISYLADNPLVVQFIHRNLAYLIFIMVCIWCWKALRTQGTNVFRSSRWILPALVLAQVVLGIMAVLHALDKNSFLWLGAAHQFVAMMILLSHTWFIYLLREPAKAQHI